MELYHEFLKGTLSFIACIIFCYNFSSVLIDISGLGKHKRPIEGLSDLCFNSNKFRLHLFHLKTRYKVVYDQRY